MGNQRRRGMRATAGGTTWRHRRGAPASSHEPGQPPPRPHVAPPRPVPPAPRPRPLSAPGATEARHERTSTQGRTQFVACGRDSPAPEPFGERVIPARQARAPAGGGRAPLHAASYHQPRHLRTRSEPFGRQVRRRAKRGFGLGVTDGSRLEVGLRGCRPPIISPVWRAEAGARPRAALPPRGARRSAPGSRSRGVDAAPAVLGAPARRSHSAGGGSGSI